MERPDSETLPGSKATGRVRFADFEMDLARGELLRAGRPRRLEPLPTRLLTVLLERPGHLFLRDELLERAWPDGQHGSERGLNTAIRQTRRALGDSATRPRFIETVPRRGYRFIAEVAEGPDEPAPGSGGPGRERAPRRRVGRAVVGAATAVGLAALVGRALLPDDRAELRIAVLPFDVLGAPASGELLAASLEEDLITALGTPAPDRLQVIARTSSSRYAGSDASVADIARELDVGFLIEGSLRPGSDDVQVVARLVRAGDAAEVWSEMYVLDGPAQLDAVAGAVATRVVGTLVPDSPATPELARAEPAEAARLPFLMGRHLLHDERWESRVRSISPLEEAIRLDPGFAPAHAMLAEALILTDRIVDAEPHARTARSLDPDLPLGHLVDGFLAMLLDGDQPRAEASLRRAVAEMPGNPRPMQVLAYQLLVRGRTVEALGWMERATRLDPVSAATVGDLGYFYYLAGRHADALEWCDRARELDPAAEWPLRCAFDAARAAGHAREARAAALALLERSDASGWTPRPDTAGPESDAVERWARVELARARAAVRAEQPAHYWLALALADLGRADEAALELRAAAVEEPSLGTLTAAREPRLAALRGTEGYRELLARFGL